MVPAHHTHNKKAILLTSPWVCEGHYYTTMTQREAVNYRADHKSKKTNSQKN